VRPPGAACPTGETIQVAETPLAAMARRLKKFSEDTSTSPEFIDSNTLNFKPNFKFSRFKIFLGDPVPLGCALASLGNVKALINLYWFASAQL